MDISAGVMTRSVESVQPVWFAFVQVFNNKELVWTKWASEGHYQRLEAVKDMRALVKKAKAGDIL